jgi:HAE1 family hydrophobic/amphiphilic exporter-1
VRLIETCIERPVGVSVGVLLLVLFGLLALYAIPIQLTPNVDIPIITVSTFWEGASPQEIEREIIDRQEEELRSVQGLREMRSTSQDNRGEITLEFYNDVDKDIALRDVTDKLRRVSGYPPDVEQPTVFAADTARDSEIAWLILYSDPHRVLRFLVLDAFETLHADPQAGEWDTATLADRARDAIRQHVAARAAAAAQGEAIFVLRDAALLEPRMATASFATEIHALYRELGQSGIEPPYRPGLFETRVDDARIGRIFGTDLKTLVNDELLPTLRDFAEDYIKVDLDQVSGVASTDIYGGIEREVQVRIDAGQLAARGLTFGQVEAALRQQNANVSAGTVGQGKRNFSVRTIGKYDAIEQILDTVIAYTDGGPVYVRNVAEVEQTFKKQYGFVRSKGTFVLAFPVRREVGTNVMQVMAELRETIAHVNRDVLVARKLGLRFEQVYDETVYIDQAIALVRNNMLIGGTLAIIVLMLFLRNWRATAVVALSIPISVIGTFLVVRGLGRTLNVISLAGIAFAIGMVVDSAIVVLENIYRHYQMGKSPGRAALDGAREVWGAVLASTLTTMAVFIPVILVREEAGQLFRDISVATVAAVGLALIVSLTVIPTMATRFLALGGGSRSGQRIARDADASEHGLARLAGRATDFLNHHGALRMTAIVLMVGLSVGLTPLFVPETTYLPSGNRNLVFGSLITPPGYSVDEYERMAKTVEEVVAPYWEVQSTDSPEYAALAGQWQQIAAQRIAGMGDPEFGPLDVEAWLQFERSKREWRAVPPPIENFFFVTFSKGCFMGCRSTVPGVVKPLERLLLVGGSRVPGVIPFFRQSSIFRIGGGNNAEIQVRGDNLAQVVAAAEAIQMACLQEMGSFAQPSPGNYNLGRPEVQIVPDRERAADLGLNVRDVGFIVEAAVEGAYVGDYRVGGGDTIDIALQIQGQQERATQQIGDIPIYTPTGNIVPLYNAVTLVDTTALEEIKHIERQRAVSLTVNPPETMSLEKVIDKVKDDIEPELRAAGKIDDSVIVSLAGNASKLVTARNTMIGEWQGFTLRTLVNIVSSRFFLSILIVYLLMAALYESWVYPFVIMFSVPLAIFGGFVGLTFAYWGTLLTTYQPIQQLDVVTFLGFVILVGIVVNNAILLVDQALRNLREHGLAPQAAIREAVKARVRPILMTSLTTIAGQMPLALFPGAGSELYRGLAAVMVGGLLVSALGTLVLVPSVLGLVFDTQQWFARLRGRTTTPATASSES